MQRFFVLLAVVTSLCWSSSAEYAQVVVAEGAHPACISAAEILVERLGLSTEALNQVVQPEIGKGVILVVVVMGGGSTARAAGQLC